MKTKEMRRNIRQAKTKDRLEKAEERKHPNPSKIELQPDQTITTDVVVIGTGIVGGTITRYFRSKGVEVLTVDSKQKLAASKCSFGVWKESWINESIKQQVEEGLKISDLLFEIEELQFTEEGKKETLKRINVNQMVLTNQVDVVGHAKLVRDNFVLVNQAESPGDTMYLKQIKIIARKGILICAGAYTNEILKDSDLIPKSTLDAYWGIIVKMRGKIQENRIKTWAPYKQSVLLQDDGNHIAFGDGCTVKNPIEADRRLKNVIDRMELHKLYILDQQKDKFHLNTEQEFKGLRPYIGKNDSLINQYGKKIWAITGTAKNGTILAGWLAKTMQKELKV